MRFGKCFWAFVLMWLAWPAMAQDITVATVSRSPFSMEVDGVDTGFSVDLMTAIGAELGRSVTFDRYDSFGDMLGAVQSGTADAAIANISITSERELIMDFSQPIFDSGLQVMMANKGSASGSIVSALFTREIAAALGIALTLIFGVGMIMWFFERGRQPYFDRPAKEAAFPAFWWALNLVVNGGFEERVPQSRVGRGFAVLLVIASLFIVSIFVAQITAALTVNAINSSVEDLNDLDGRRVGTVGGSTTTAFLDSRGIQHIGFAGLDELLEAFENEDIEAVVFDGPILAYYANEKSKGEARVLERVYRPENYGIAFPDGSGLREEVNQVILRFREDGTFAELRNKWFGPTYSR